jgi:lipooligosaccharide transport system permease protein
VSTVPSALPAFEHRLVAYRRVWRGSVFSSFLLPVLFFLGLGVSVGGYVDRGGVLGVPYLDYLAPGLLASTALQVAIGETTWPVLGGFVWNRIYHGMRASPLRPRDIAAGESLFVSLRVASAAAAFLVVMAAFGTVHSWWGAAALPAAVLTGFAVIGPLLAFSATIKNDNMFALLYRLAVIPVTLFAGVFFPVEALPLVVRWIAYASPLWHGVQLCRAATLGWPTALPISAHALYLGLWAVGGFLLAQARFTKRLSD